MPDSPRAARLRRRLTRLRSLTRVTRRKLLRQLRIDRRKHSLGYKAWQAAGKDLGVREQGGNNSGPDVARIIRDGGGNPADKPPWCVYGVAHWFKDAGSEADWDRAWGAVRNVDEIPGVKIRSTGKHGHPVRFTFDHIGLFGYYCDYLGKRVRRSRATHILTREANTGASGAVSDSKGGGDGVYEKVRPLALVADYLEVTK